jgi:hypothetical protein
MIIAASQEPMGVIGRHGVQVGHFPDFAILAQNLNLLVVPMKIPVLTFTETTSRTNTNPHMRT